MWNYIKSTFPTLLMIIVAIVVIGGIMFLPQAASKYHTPEPKVNEIPSEQLYIDVVETNNGDVLILHETEIPEYIQETMNSLETDLQKAIEEGDSVSILKITEAIELGKKLIEQCDTTNVHIQDITIQTSTKENG